jgi:hypothetical protein
MPYAYQRLIWMLLLAALLSACGATAPTSTSRVPPGPLPDPAPADRGFPVAQPVGYDQILQRGDRQVLHWLALGTPSSSYATTADLAAIPRQPAIPAEKARSAGFTTSAGLIGPSLIATTATGIYRRDSAETTILPSGGRFAGVLQIGGDFMAGTGDVHDLLITVLLDYRQVSFELGDQRARAHILRLPRGKMLLYDLRLLDPLTDGEHVLTITIDWDPYAIYTTRAVRGSFAAQDHTTWLGAGQMMIDTVQSANVFLRAGQGAPRTPPLQAIEGEQLPQAASQPLIMLRSSTFDPQWSPAVALGADEPGRLYAYLHYEPDRRLKEPEQNQAALVVLLDGQQLPIGGQPVTFLNVQAGRLYRVPIDLDLPHDGRVHTLNAVVAFTPFLPTAYFMQERPPGFYPQVHAAPVVPIVPTHDWIYWMPEADS